MNRTILPFLSLALAAAVATADDASPAPAPAPADDDVAVRIDGEPAVLKSEVDELVSIQLAMSGAPRSLPPAQEKTLRRNCTDRLVATWLLMREAREKGVSVTDEEFNAFLARPGAPNPEEISRRMGGVASVEHIRADIRSGMIGEKILAPLTNSVAQPTEDEIRARFDRIVAANPAALQVPEQVTAAHVLVLVPKDAPAEQDAAALEKINGIRDRALAGEDFGALAAQFSEDPGSKDKGGVYTFGRGRMVKPFEDAAFSQPIGEIGEPVRTSYGYHVLKVIDRTEARTIGFDDVRESIAAALRREALERVVGEHFKELREAARIEYPGEAVVSAPVEVPAAP